MAFCKSCGNQLEDGSKFCANCGSASEEAANTASANNNTDNQGFKIEDRTGDYDKQDIEQNKVVCAISYLSILFFLPLVACPNSRYGKFHANQALILLIASVLIGIVGSVCTGVIWAIPFIPDVIQKIAASLVNVVVAIAPTAAMIFGIVNALQGQAKEIPLIGRFNLINK